MKWWRRPWRAGSHVRAYVLVGLLAAILIGVYSVDERARALRTRSSIRSAPPAVASLPAAAPRSAPATPTPPGWGADPFQRSFQP
ncbi:MAG TPA: hypothetical protein VLT84_01780 [Acidobacteriota bacterium]|nr:hypothetical protein [Acidobacteriota bacterium]